MESMNNIAVEKLMQADHLFVLYSGVTGHPFVRYDKEAGKDRIHIYYEETAAEDEAEMLSRYGYQMTVSDVPKEIRRLFFANLHALGVDQVVFKDTASTTTLDVNTIHPLDLSRIPAQQRPHLNPALQITSIYFLQEMTRNVPEDQLTEDDRLARSDLDREFSSYLASAKYLVPIHVKNLRADRPGQRISQKNFDPVYVADSQGKSWLPIFSDVTEFDKFNDGGQFHAVLFELPQIRQLVGTQMAGAILNARSQAYRLIPRVLELLADSTVDHHKN